MSYLGKISRNKVHTAVIGDWMSVNSLRARNPSQAELINVGFTEDSVKYLIENDSYDEAIIASLISTHTDENSSVSIFKDDQSKANFCQILCKKTEEFKRILELIALQCPVNIVCDVAPNWIENRRVISRIRREYREDINKITLKLFTKKKKIYNYFNLSEPEIIELCNQEVRGRVKAPKVEELIQIDKALKEAEQKNLRGINKYIYVAHAACVFINQVYYREEMRLS